MTSRTATQRPYFECIATIEAGLFMIRKFMDAQNHRTAIERMIDDAAGMEKNDKRYLMPIVQDIRDARAEIGMDTEADDKLISVLSR